MTSASSSFLLLAAAFHFAARHAPAQDAEAPASKKYEEIQVSDGGAVAGRVTFKGAPPDLKLTVTQDLPHCSHDAKNERPSPRLSVGADGGVAGAVVFLREIAKGKPLASLKSEKKLDQKDCTYTPFVQVVPFKETLKIVNSDPLNHNVHGKIGDRDVFNNAMPNTGWPKTDELDKRMTRPGVVSVQCDVHSWMSAYIVVARHPYYCVTSSDGKFELADIPPGEYDVVAWHPGWDFKVNRDASGRATGYDYGKPVEKAAKIKIESKGSATADFVLNEAATTP